jgi:hypothetical protein
MAGPLVPGPSCLEVKIATEKLRKYKSSGSDQIPEELIQAGDEILLSAIHNNNKQLTALWLWSANGLYQLSDSRLPAKLVPTFADRGVPHSQNGGSLMAVISVF